VWKEEAPDPAVRRAACGRLGQGIGAISEEQFCVLNKSACMGAFPFQVGCGVLEQLTRKVSCA